jgi:hypothetical protein
MGSMGRFLLLRTVLAVAFIAALCAPFAAQTEAGEDLSAAGLKVKQVPEPVPHLPYSADIEYSRAVAQIGRASCRERV